MDTSGFPKYFPYIACFRYQMGNLLFPEYPRIRPIIYSPVFPAVCAADDLGKFFFNQSFDCGSKQYLYFQGAIGSQP